MVTFMAQTHELSDGGHLRVSVISDPVERERRTAQTWSFRWCQVQLSTENLTTHAIPNVGTSDSKTGMEPISIGTGKNGNRNEHRLTVWIPLCYLPDSLPVVRQRPLEAGNPESGLLPLPGSSCQNPIIFIDLESDSD